VPVGRYLKLALETGPSVISFRLTDYNLKQTLTSLEGDKKKIVKYWHQRHFNLGATHIAS